MKLIIGIVHKDDASATTKALNAEGYYVTRLATTGGFLKKGNVTILVGTDEDKVAGAVEIIQNNAKKRVEKEHVGTSSQHGELYEPAMKDGVVGGATVFVVEVDRFEKV